MLLCVSAVLALTPPDGLQTVYIYTNSGMGSDVESITAAGLQTKCTYNAQHQQETATDPSNVVTTSHHDQYGRTDYTIVAGVRTDFTYDDGASMALTDTKSAGRTTHRDYDSFGRMDYIVDPNGNATDFHYDNLNRVTQKDYPDGRIEKCEYAPQGQGNFLIKYTDRTNRTTEFAYDNAGRCTTKILKDSNGAVVDTITLGYNTAGQLETEASADGTVTHVHDTRGRLSSVSHADSTTAFTYNNDDTIATKDYPGQHLVYNYEQNDPNNLGRLMSINGSDGNVSLTYDSKGRMQFRTLPGGIRQQFGYDDAGRTNYLQHTVGGAPIETYSAHYNGNGQLDTVTGDNYADVFGYDGAGRLASEQRVGINGFSSYNYGYTYDSNDNRATISGTKNSVYHYNSINQLTSIDGDGAASYGYDDAGNQTYEQQLSGDLATVTSQFDILDRLKSVNSVGLTQTNNTTHSYYGPTWMKASTTVNGVQTTFNHDGWLRTSAMKNGATTTYMVPGDTALWENTNGQIQTYTGDVLGSVTGRWNGANYTNRYTYNAFGETTSFDGSNNVVPNSDGFRYRGGWHNAVSNIYDNRMRGYRPDLSQFASLDPARSQLNLYGYAGQCPTCYDDPRGLYIQFLNEPGVDPTTRFQGTNFDDNDPNRSIQSLMESDKTRVWYFRDMADMAEQFKNGRNVARWKAQLAADGMLAPAAPPPGVLTQVALGGFNRQGATTGGAWANTVIGFTPYVQQVAAARDTIAAISDFSEEPTWSVAGNVLLNGAAAIPIVGWFVKPARAAEGAVATEKALAAAENAANAERLADDALELQTIATGEIPASMSPYGSVPRDARATFGSLPRNLQITGVGGDLLKMQNGDVLFKNMRIQVQEDLTHLSEDALDRMVQDGTAPRAAPVLGQARGEIIELHHVGQNPNGPLWEIRASDHDRILNPFPGLSQEERAQFAEFRRAYWQARAIEELARRGK